MIKLIQIYIVDDGTCFDKYDDAYRDIKRNKEILNM